MEIADIMYTYIYIFGRYHLTLVARAHNDIKLVDLL